MPDRQMRASIRYEVLRTSAPGWPHLKSPCQFPDCSEHGKCVVLVEIRVAGLAGGTSAKLRACPEHAKQTQKDPESVTSWLLGSGASLQPEASDG